MAATTTINQNEPPEATVKRGRGRPRKPTHKTPADPRSFDAVAGTIKDIPPDKPGAPGRNAVKDKARATVALDARVARAPAALIILNRVLDEIRWTEGRCRFSLAWFANECGLSRRAVTYAFKRLGDAGHAIRRRRKSSHGGWDYSEVTLPVLAQVWAGMQAQQSAEGVGNGNSLGREQECPLPSVNPSGMEQENRKGDLHKEYYGLREKCEDPPLFSFELSDQILEEPAIEERTLAEIHYSAIMDKTMLGWIDEHTLTEAVFDGGPYEEDLEAVYALASDTELRERLLAAGDSRIGRRLLNAGGLHSVRWLVAALVREGDREQEAVTPAKALVTFLAAVEARIGLRQGQWLNSWQLIGHRIAGRRYDGGDEVEQASAEESLLLSILVGNDPAKGLSAKLKRDAGGLTAFVAEQAAEHGTPVDTVGEIMRSVLARGLFGDIRSGAIKSWKYFEGPIADEMRRVALTADGIRPGDVLGKHMRRSNDA